MAFFKELKKGGNGRPGEPEKRGIYGAIKKKYLAMPGDPKDAKYFTKDRAEQEGGGKMQRTFRGFVGEQTGEGKRTFGGFRDILRRMRPRSR